MYLIIDQGTSSTKSFIIDNNGKITLKNKIAHKLDTPKINHIECDALEIYKACKLLIAKSISAYSKGSIVSLGLSVQRSTFLFWDKDTIQPVTKALSWQDSRSKDIVKRFKKKSDWIFKTTGLPLSPHFGAPKYLKMIDDYPFLKQLIKDDRIIFGPLSSYLTHALTGKPFIDHSIASRTLLFDINSCSWSDDCLKLFNIPKSVLPIIKPIKYNYGKVLNYDFSLKCVIGDQQAALIGQNGLKKDSIGMNFGTSASILYNSGKDPILVPGLVTSVLFSKKNKITYLTEGTINACNSLFYYFEKILNISHENMKWNERCKNKKTNGIFITGFSGIASPYWVSGFKDIYWNINKNNDDEIIRAGMESIGFLTNDIINIINNRPKNINGIIASGGGARSSLLHFIADITKQHIISPEMKDKTAFGVFKILSGKYDIRIKVSKKVYKPKNNISSSKLKKWSKLISSIKN